MPVRGLDNYFRTDEILSHAHYTTSHRIGSHPRPFQMLNSVPFHCGEYQNRYYYFGQNLIIVSYTQRGKIVRNKTRILAHHSQNFI